MYYMFIFFLLSYKISALESGEYVLDWYRKGKFEISPERNLQLLLGQKGGYENIVILDADDRSATIQIHGEYVCIDETGILVKVCNIPTTFAFKKLGDRFLIKNDNKCVNVKRLKDKDGVKVGVLRMGRCGNKRKWRLVRVYGDPHAKAGQKRLPRRNREKSLSARHASAQTDPYEGQNGSDTERIAKTMAERNKKGSEDADDTIKRTKRSISPRDNTPPSQTNYTPNITRRSPNDPFYMLDSMTSALNSTEYNPRFNPVPLFDKGNVSFQDQLSDKFRRRNERNLREILHDQKTKTQNGIKEVPAIDDPSKLNSLKGANEIGETPYLKKNAQKRKNRQPSASHEDFIQYKNPDDEELEGKNAQKRKNRKSSASHEDSIQYKNPDDEELEGENAEQPFLSELKTERKALETERDKNLHNTVSDLDGESRKADRSRDKRSNNDGPSTESHLKYVNQLSEDNRIDELLQNFTKDEKEESEEVESENSSHTGESQNDSDKKNPKKPRKRKNIRLIEPMREITNAELRDYNTLDHLEQNHVPVHIPFEPSTVFPRDHSLSARFPIHPSLSSNPVYGLNRQLLPNSAILSHAHPIITPVVHISPRLPGLKKEPKHQEPIVMMGTMMNGYQ